MIGSPVDHHQPRLRKIERTLDFRLEGLICSIHVPIDVLKIGMYHVSLGHVVVVVAPVTATAAAAGVGGYLCVYDVVVNVTKYRLEESKSVLC